MKHSSLVAVALSVAIAALSSAADVAFQLTGRETWVGDAALLEISVSGAKGRIPDPVLPKVDGLLIELAPGRSTQNAVEFINGQMSQSSSVTLTVHLTPKRVGKFSVPPVTIRVDGKDHSSGVLTLVAGMEVDAEPLLVDVVAKSPTVYLGESLDVTLRIWVRPFVSRAQGVRFGEQDMWVLLTQQSPEWGAFEPALREMAQQHQRPRGAEQLRNDTAYYVYEVPMRITPTRGGAPDLGSIRIGMDYPTSVSVSRRTFGPSEVRVTASKALLASADTSAITVLDAPAEGRPADWRGAIGRFSVSAQARPTTVSVGDPITVTYRLHSLDAAASLDVVQPPPFSELPELTRDFRIPSDPLAGTVSGSVKEFTQTLRPMRPGIDEIPAIPFSWFDTQAQQYRTAWSEAIPIVVRVGEVLRTDDVVSPTATTGAGAGRREIGGGLVASAPANAAMLVSEGPLHPTTLALIAGLPPAAFAAALLISMRRRRHESDSGLARSNAARGLARKRLKEGDVAGALLGFIADRTGRTSGTITRSAASAICREHGLAEADLAELDSVLAQCEGARYAGAAATTDAEFRQRGADCLDRLHRVNWQRSTGGNS